MQQNVSDPRVQKMFSGDRIWAFGAVAVLWAVYGFTFWKLSANAGAAEVLVALAIAGGLVLLFCTASIIAMINHYSDDKEHIYGLDIYYLDEMKKARG
jgi:RsiW-degrading membrane proteinase PrsW (M82 family)